ncbi:MAG: hypothetical protein C0436_03705 [Alphaproteobacteria bacterium]|nr:hypothetical protein [Alphaproteobacteria bacterium]
MVLIRLRQVRWSGRLYLAQELALAVSTDEGVGSARILAFELQARLHGGLSKTVLRQINLAAEGAATPRRLTTETLMPGGRYIREWARTSHVVDVTPEGYRWKEGTYRSLSAIAREITGAHWSGPRFFGLPTSGANKSSKHKVKDARP